MWGKPLFLQWKKKAGLNNWPVPASKLHPELMTALPLYNEKILGKQIVLNQLNF